MPAAGDMVYTFRYLGDAQVPWKKCKPMDEHLKFVARLLDGEKMSSLCREFSISFHKIIPEQKFTGSLHGVAPYSDFSVQHWFAVQIQWAQLDRLNGNLAYISQSIKKSYNSVQFYFN